MASKESDNSSRPPFETEELRVNLARFLDTPFTVEGKPRPVGNFKWGVYAFYDYDNEPIYVGQTNERLRTRVRRHLTNQRTDAVAMSVLDPFEVFNIKVWPLPQFQERSGKDVEAKMHLNALERQIYNAVIAESHFKAVLNEKNPPPGDLVVEVPPSHEGCIVSDAVLKIRSHLDFRIARRALIISRLAQVIAERKVQGGLRRVLSTQAKRLEWLAERRYKALGGPASVPAEEVDDED